MQIDLQFPFYFCCCVHVRLASDHGLWTPDEAFFIKIPNFWASGQTSWTDKFSGTWDILSQFIGTHFVTLEPCHFF